MVKQILHLDAANEFDDAAQGEVGSIQSNNPALKLAVSIVNKRAYIFYKML